VEFRISGSDDETAEPLVEFSFEGSPYTPLPAEQDENGDWVVSVPGESLTLAPGEDVSVDVRVTFSEADTYTVTLTASDADGLSVSDSVVTAVTAPDVQV